MIPEYWYHYEGWYLKLLDSRGWVNDAWTFLFVYHWCQDGFQHGVRDREDISTAECSICREPIPTATYDHLYHFHAIMRQRYYDHTWPKPFNG